MTLDAHLVTFMGVTITLGRALTAAATFALSVSISLLVTSVVLVRLPADHFAGGARKPTGSRLRRVGRHVLGVLLIALGGVLMLPGVPGQGLLTVLLGLMCLDLPIVRRLELRIVRRPRVRAAIDRLRARYGAAPLVLPDAPPDALGPR